MFVFKLSEFPILSRFECRLSSNCYSHRHRQSHKHTCATWNIVHGLCDHQFVALVEQLYALVKKVHHSRHPVFWNGMYTTARCLLCATSTGEMAGNRCIYTREHCSISGCVGKLSHCFIFYSCSSDPSHSTSLNALSECVWLSTGPVNCRHL